MNILSNKKIVLIIGICLVAIGLFKPDLSSILPSPIGVVETNSLQLEQPKDPAIQEACDQVIQILRSGPSSRKQDGVRLASLYCDLASLISLDEDEQSIKSTLEIREANKLAGKLSHLNLKDKYDGLSEAANGVLVAALGDDDSVLDPTLRQRAVSAFRNLAWACVEGAK